MIRELRHCKREWVLSENSLGDLIEKRTRLAAKLESMRVRLVRAAAEPHFILENAANANRLAQRLVTLNTDLEQDDDLHHETGRLISVCNSLRNRLEQSLLKSEIALHELILSTSRDGIGLSLQFLMNHGALLGKWSDNDIDSLLGEAICTIEARYATKPNLYRAGLVDDTATLSDVRAIVAHARQGFLIDLSRASSETLCAIVLRYGRALLPAQTAPATTMAAKEWIRGMSRAQRSQAHAIINHWNRISILRAKHRLPVCVFL